MNIDLLGGPLIPRIDVELDVKIPAEYSYWTPGPDDYDEEGFGFFRDTWLIRGVPLSQATEIAAIEQEMVQVVDRFSTSPDEFEHMALALEYVDEDEVPERVRGGDEWPELARFISEIDPFLLGGLDLGISGVVHALAVVGCWPAASCRGHAGERPWTTHPVVYVAADQHRANALQTCVAEAGCGFTQDPYRSELLVVMSQSILEMMELAALILGQRSEFKLRRMRSTKSQPANYQPTLWD